MDNGPYSDVCSANGIDLALIQEPDSFLSCNQISRRYHSFKNPHL